MLNIKINYLIASEAIMNLENVELSGELDS